MFIYTFRAFPFIDQLNELSDQVFIFSKLKEDLMILTKKLVEDCPDYLVGIAVTKGLSRIEPVAVNKFNKGAVIVGSVNKLALLVPNDVSFCLANRPSHTFCNWTMYRLQYFINQNNLATKLTFIHINPRDIGHLKELSSLKLQ